MNLGLQRFAPPIEAAIDASRSAFVAELGYEAFRRQLAGRASALDGDAIDRVKALIARHTAPGAEIVAPSRLEREAATTIADRLSAFVSERNATTVVPDPRLPGCGIIDEATGDLLMTRRGAESDRGDGSEPDAWLLYEIKAVDRPFRAADLRQLVTYCALLAADNRTPSVVGLVNPRRGAFFECDLDALALDVAGLHAEALTQEIIFDISATDVSR